MSTISVFQAGLAQTMVTVENQRMSKLEGIRDVKSNLILYCWESKEVVAGQWPQR